MASELAKSDSRPSWWKQFPNAISIARLCACPVLLCAVLAGNRGLFRWLLVACLLSDIADGLIARIFGLRSALGAALDSAADIVVSWLVVLAVCAFESAFVASHWGLLVTVTGLYLAETGLSLRRYRRCSSFHTVLYRVAAYSEGIFVVCLFFRGYTAWLFYSMVALLILASAEELALLLLLPEWRADVGGLYQVLCEKGARSA